MCENKRDGVSEEKQDQSGDLMNSESWSKLSNWTMWTNSCLITWTKTGFMGSLTPQLMIEALELVISSVNAKTV